MTPSPDDLLDDVEIWTEPLNFAGAKLLHERGVAVEVMFDEQAPRIAFVEFGGACGFDFVDKGDGVRAIILPAYNQFGELADLVAWGPRSGRIATLWGSVAVLGENFAYGPRLTTDGNLRVFSDPYRWLAACRQGVVIVDGIGARHCLDGLGPLVPDDVKHGLELRKMLTIPAPRIVVEAA